MLFIDAVVIREVQCEEALSKPFHIFRQPPAVGHKMVHIQTDTVAVNTGIG